MRYLSVCSGIEAATVAWAPLGWTPVAFSEIEAFPSAVLAHHFPDTPNVGDMTAIATGETDVRPFDLLVGGTPCQSFSVAGLRKGLADPRGNLAFAYLEIAKRHRPEWLVWENVPGTFSATSHAAPDPCPPDIDLDGDDGPADGTEVVVEDEYDADEDHAFACFLAGLQELGYGFAYRTLDAQYFGLAQRRRRVFVVGCLGDWRRAAAVLFERHSLQGHPPPRRETGEGAAACVGGGVDGGRISGAISSKWAKGTGGPAGDEAYNLVTHALRADGFDAREDGTGRGTPLVPVAFDTTQITSAGNYSAPKPGDPCHPLAAGAHPAAVAFTCKDYGADAGDSSPTLRAMGHDGSHANAGGQVAVATEYAVRRLTPRECERLQGVPDDFTAIQYRNGTAADGPRYKALGNSIAVPVLRWIGERIEAVHAIGNEPVLMEVAE